jgi:PKD repeat protein
MTLAILFLTQCKRLPVADFSVAPTINPEAGDSIFFTNLSIDAITYEWDFGDGYTSNEENPYNTYIEASTYDVMLTAFNEDGEHSITKQVQIFEPTVLGLYVYYDDEVTVMTGADVFVYDNEYDYENFNDAQYYDDTDADGLALFLNLEAQIYYIDVFKADEGGIWYAGGPTAALTQNEINSYWIACQFFADGKKSLRRKRPEGEANRPQPVIK